MKIIMALAALLTSFVALADEELGRLTLSIRPTQDSGVYSTEIRDVGNKILGRTSFGSMGLVNLKYGGGEYKGSAGGAGMTKLFCEAGACKGQIGGAPTYFTYETAITQAGEVILLKGQMNHQRFTAGVSAEKVVVRALGTMTLDTPKANRRGQMGLEGRGSLSAHPQSQFEARIEGTGTLSFIEDPGLLAIFIVRPFVNR